MNTNSNSDSPNSRSNTSFISKEMSSSRLRALLFSSLDLMTKKLAESENSTLATPMNFTGTAAELEPTRMRFHGCQLLIWLRRS